MNSTPGRDRVHGDVVDAVADLGRRVRNVLRIQAFIDRLPALAAVVGAESARGGDRDINSVGIAGIENDGVQAHASGAGLPLGAGAVAAQAGEFLPVLAAVGGAKQSGVFDSGVDGVGIGERRLEMPDALELPGMLRAVIELMCGQRLRRSRRTCRRQICCSRLWAGREPVVSPGGVPGWCQVLPPSSER